MEGPIRRRHSDFPVDLHRPAPNPELGVLHRRHPGRGLRRRQQSPAAGWRQPHRGSEQVQRPPETAHSHQPPPTTTGQPTGGEWTVGAHYGVGDIVTYNGQRYRCLQAHTVYDPGWTPTAAPALWQAL
ncbi:carbohydrate-binding protein [Nocardia tengchongensis]